jgi:hypothetical protein
MISGIVAHASVTMLMISDSDRASSGAGQQIRLFRIRFAQALATSQEP